MQLPVEMTIRYFPKPTLLLTACHILFFAWAELFIFVILLLAAFIMKADIGQLPVIVLSGLVASSAIYFILALCLRCPSCGRRFLLETLQQKHSAAHKLRGLDHWATTALDIVRFRKFTCMYCGVEFGLKPK